MARIAARGISEEVVKSFKEYVIRKYGKLDSVYGQEVEKALIKYLDTSEEDEEHTHTHRTFTQKSRKKEITSRSGSEEFHPAYANGGEFEIGGSPDPNEPEISPTERTKRKIVRYLEEKGMMEAESISENAIRRVIGIIAGHDKRTVDKYFHILEEECLLPGKMKIIYPQRLERYPHFKR